MTSQALKNNTDTIVAIASAPGRGGVGVVRLSGTDLSVYVSSLLGEARVLKPRYAHYASFYDAEGMVLDQGWCCHFQLPTPLLEACHGVTQPRWPCGSNSLINRCIELGARLARPGEFSERAFLNDKLSWPGRGGG